LLSYPPKISISATARQAVGPRPFMTAGRDDVEVDLTEAPTERDLLRLQHDLQQESTRLRQRRGSGKGDAMELDAFAASFDLACNELTRIRTCPVCGSVGDLDGLSAQTFNAKCRTCSTRWGLRHDPSSEHRVPYIWIGEDLRSLPTGNGLRAWLGRDVLAEPCMSSEAEYSSDLINPWTGRCTASTTLTAVCERCRGIDDETRRP